MSQRASGTSRFTTGSQAPCPSQGADRWSRFGPAGRQLTIRVLLGAICATLLLAVSTANANPLPVDVTAGPLVQRDLLLAERYWAIEDPGLAAPCAPEQVVVAPMAPATGNDGVTLPAATVWAETDLSSCVIDISRSMWRAMRAHARPDRRAACAMFAHEYGHTLGLADTASVPILNMDSGRQDDPLCARAIGGWRRTSPRDRIWLALNNLATLPKSWAQLGE